MTGIGGPHILPPVRTRARIADPVQTGGILVTVLFLEAVDVTLHVGVVVRTAQEIRLQGLMIIQDC